MDYWRTTGFNNWMGARKARNYAFRTFAGSMLGGSLLGSAWLTNAGLEAVDPANAPGGLLRNWSDSPGDGGFGDGASFGGGVTTPFAPFIVPPSGGGKGGK